MFKNAKYEAVDDSLNGIPSLLASKYDPTRYQARQSGVQTSATPAASPAATSQAASSPSADPRYQGTLAKVASALSGVVRGATFGLLDPITKKVYPAGGKILEESKAANPTESAIGEMAGTVGSAFLNPAAGAAGVGALRAALPGARILPMAARNAVLTATTALPQAAGQIANGEGVGKAAGEFARNMGAGTVLGTAGEKVLSKLPEILGKVKKIATNTAVRQGLDIDPKSFKNAATIGGKIRGSAARGRAEDLGSDLVDLMNREGIHSEAEKEAWLAAQKAKWGDVDKAFDQSGAKVSDFYQSINADPVVQGFLTTHGQAGKEKLQQLIEQADKKAGIGDIRKFLQDRIDYFRKSPKDLVDADLADVTKAVRDAVDSAFVPPELKAQYSQYKAIDDALTREDFRNPKTFSVGSQTAGRMIGQGLATGAVGGATGFDPNDPDSLRRVLTRSALGFVGGSLAPRAGVAIGNALTGRLAARLAPLIPEITITGERIGPAAAKLAGRIGGAADQTAAPAAASSQTGPDASPEVPTETRVQTEEQKAAPENIAAAKAATNSAWGETVKQKLDALYDAYIAPEYSDLLSREDFMAQMNQLTNGFDPKKTAGFVFTDKTEKENYLRSYEAALRLKNLQKQYQGGQGGFIDEALGGGSALDPIALTQSRVLGTHKNLNEKMAYNQLRDWAASLMTEQGKPVAKATLDQVSKDLDTIINLRVPAARKRQLLVDHLANYGLNVDQLMKYGQIEGVTA